MALTKYAYWDFSDGGLAPKFCHSDEVGFNLLIHGSLTYEVDHYKNNASGYVATNFANNEGPFCKDDFMCFKTIFDTTVAQQRNLFGQGINAGWGPFSVWMYDDLRIGCYNNGQKTTNTYKIDGTKNELEIHINRATSLVKFILNGVETSFGYSVPYDISQPNISFGDVFFGNGIHTPFIGNMYKLWYANDPSGLSIEPKFLFKKNGNYYKFNNLTDSMDLLGTTVTENDFITNGIASASSKVINKSVFEGYIPIFYRIINTPFNFAIDFKPKKVLVKGSGDILLNAKQIKKVKNFTLTGTGDVRVAFSIDSGLSWKKYNSVSGLLEDIVMDVDTILVNGNTMSEINTIPESIWSEAVLAQKIRFAYALNKANYSDIIKVDKLSMKVDIWGYLSEYREAEVRLRNGYSEVVLNTAGTYVVTYL